MEYFIALLLLGVAILLICREIICWHLKINRRVDLLEKIEEHLSILAGAKKTQTKPAMSDSHNFMSNDDNVLSDRDNLLIERYYEIKKEKKLEHVDVVKILKEKYKYSDSMIQDAFKKSYNLQNQI